MKHEVENWNVTQMQGPTWLAFFIPLSTSMPAWVPLVNVKLKLINVNENEKYTYKTKCIQGWISNGYLEQEMDMF